MKLYTSGGVTLLRSPLLPCPHGFSTRIGGISTLPHTASLNLGFGLGEDDEIVKENLSRFSSAIGLTASSVVSTKQVHGATVLYCTEENQGDGYDHPAHEADGSYTDRVGVTVAVKTADCVPILLCGCDDEKRPKAVMALHAGWRGTVSEIVTVGIKQLSDLGIAKKNVFAAIGPSIGLCCYEVDDAFRETFFSRLSKDVLDGTFLPSETTEGKWYCDLKTINKRLLLASGIPEENVDASSLCTACRQDLFYSHRASGGKRGSMLSMIALPESGN